MADQLPRNPRSDVLDVPGPTPASVADAKRAQAIERAEIEARTGLVFVGDRLTSRAEEYDRLAEVIAFAITRAANSRAN